jgi:hypothetical protein
MSRKGFIRVGATAFIASAAVFAMPGLANASVSNDYVTASPNCQALEFTRLENGHDHMYVDPTIDNSDCLYGIWNMNTNSWVYPFPTTSPAGNQGDVYDGPGMRLQVIVIDRALPNAEADGIPN